MQPPIHSRRSFSKMLQVLAVYWIAGAGTSCLAWSLAAADASPLLQSLRSRAIPVPLQQTWRNPQYMALAVQDSLVCFDSELEIVINAGCFQGTPGADGQCGASTNHFFVQIFEPNIVGPARVIELVWLSNDAATVFPSVGVVAIPRVEDRFPTPSELANLQLQNVSSDSDFGVAVADFSALDIAFDASHYLAVCLQFPNGTLSAFGSGPGIAADETDNGQPCLRDFFTTSAGQGDWFVPDDDALDWGFELVIESQTAVESLTWSLVRKLYR